MNRIVKQDKSCQLAARESLPNTNGALLWRVTQGVLRVDSAAPETISRVFANMREMAFLQGRRPQKARFSSQVLRAQSLMPGISASGPAQRSLLVGA
jgi:hypothetical protein